MKCFHSFWSAVTALLLSGALVLGALPSKAGTVAYWRFEEGFADSQMVHVSGVNGTWSADVPDSSGNGNALSVWTGEAWGGFLYKGDVPAPVVTNTGVGNFLSIKNSGGNPGCWCNTLRTWTPAQWTIEATFKPETGGYRTLVGRDSLGAGPSTPMAALYLQIQNDSSVAVKFQDVAGKQYSAASVPALIKGFAYSSDPEGVTGTWYSLAAVSNGTTLSLYLNNLTAGTGYELVGQTDLTTQGSSNTSLTAGLGSGGDWTAGDFTVGRGLYNGGHVDRAFGFIDEVRISDTALVPNQFLWSTGADTEIRGTITDAFTGSPAVGATVTIGAKSSVTDSAGKYSIFNLPGQTLPMTVTHPYAESIYTSTATYPATGFVTKDASIKIRPNLNLGTASGYSWKALVNTGSTADYSAVSADESAFVAYTVPGSWEAISAIDDIYGWARVHFTLPPSFLTSLPGRAVRLHVVGGIDDVNQTYLNGTLIGKAGSFPSPGLDVQPTGHTNPPTGQTYATSWSGLDPAWNEELNYTFPASLLNSTDNVLAVRCFDMTSNGGILGTITLEVAEPTGAVKGVVTAGGTPLVGARVAVSDADGLTSAFGWTDIAGAFNLPHAKTGSGMLGVTKLGYLPIIAPVNVPANGTFNLALTTTAVTGGDAPVYDNFDDNAGVPTWQDKWWTVALDDNSDINNTPTVDQPGYDVSIGPSSPIASSVTVRQLANGHRSSIISKDRFSRFASVNQAKLISAKGPLAGSTDDWGINTLLNLHGNSSADPSVPTAGIAFPFVELDLEGWRSDGVNNIVQWIIWDGQNGGFTRRSNGILPIPLTQMYDVTPANPLVLTINRTGSVYDFYINGTLVHSGWLRLPMPDHRIAMYGYHILTENTWDYVAAGPVAGATAPKGDINANGMLDYGDVIEALRIAGGLSVSSSAQITAGNHAGGDSIISVLDAVRIDQALGGKAL